MQVNVSNAVKKTQVLGRARAIAEGIVPILFGKNSEAVLIYLLVNHIYGKPPAKYSEIGKGTSISLGNSLTYTLEILQKHGFIEQTNKGQRGYQLTPAGISVSRNLLALITDTIRRLESKEVTVVDPDMRQVAKEELEEIALTLSEIQDRLRLTPVMERRQM